MSFRNDFDAVRRYGKGYGEGQIVEYALAHSERLKEAPVFGKCTSKWWVVNFIELVGMWNGEFQAGLKFASRNSLRNIAAQSVDTRFYLAKRSYYDRHLAQAYLRVRDLDGYHLEHSFKDALIASNADALRILFPRAPRIRGVSGTSGTLHTGGHDELARRLKYAYRRVLLKVNTKLFPPAHA